MHRKRIISAMLPSVLCALALTAGEAQSANEALVKARQKFFGIENVDANGNVKGDKVIASWASNTTYVVSIMGRVVLLDSYIRFPELKPAGIDVRRNQFLPQDFVDLKPEAIFLGHGHGDHADNAAFVAKWTDATIYASEETCTAMQADVARMWNDPNAVNGGAKIVPSPDPVRCVPVTAAGTMPGNYDPATGRSQATRLGQMDPQVCILAFKFIHSGSAPVDTSFPHTPLANLGDPRYGGTTIGSTVYPAMFPPQTSFIPPSNLANAVPGQMNTRTTGGAGGSITIYYQFVIRGGNNFSFGYINSAGPATEGIGSDPGLVTLGQYNDPAFDPARKALARDIGASLYSLMDTLPKTDVLFGSIVSLGAAFNQQRDIIRLKQHVKPKVYYPGHLDAVAQPGSAIYHWINWRETATNMGWPQSDWPEFRVQVDPVAFMGPQVFDPKDDRWSATGGANGVPELCRGGRS